MSSILNRFSNCSPQPQRPTWGTLNLSVTSVGAVHTVTVTDSSGNTVFSGSRTGSGTVNLFYPSGASAGTVFLTWIFDFTGGLFVESFPAYYNIYYSQDSNWSYAVTGGSWTGNVATLTIGAHNIQSGEKITVAGVTPSGYNGNVTVTSVTGTAIRYTLTPNPGAWSSGGTITRQKKATKYDDGKSGAFSYYSPPGLAAGIWYVLVRQVNEDGVESTGTTLQQQRIVYVPGAPSLPSYVSGNYSNTVVSWPALTGLDATATYNIYDSLDLGVISPDVSVTRAAGSGTLTKQLKAISATFTGVRYIVLRSLLAGIESSNSVAYQIQYSNDAIILTRPNVPVVKDIATVDETLTVNFCLDTAAATIAATSVQLFAALSPGLFDYTSPIGTVAVSTPANRIVFSSVSGSVVTNGAYYFAIRSNSSNGQSLNTDYYGPVQLSLLAPSDPTVSVSGAT